MPTLQVRDLPEDLYIKLSMIPSEQNRSIAPQTIVLLRESLLLHSNNKLRRKALLEWIIRTTLSQCSDELEPPFRSDRATVPMSKN